MSKQNIGLIRILAVLILLVASITSAIATSPILADYYPRGSNFGNNQYYSAVFDGEGEAMVLAKLQFQNFNKNSLEEMIIDVPGNARMINILQETEVRHETCIRYETPPCPDNHYCIYPKDKQPESKCVQWSDSTTKKYYSVEKTYHYAGDSTRFVLKLPKEIREQETASLLLYYKTSSYTENPFGVYNFNFRTIKTNFDVNNVRIAVNVAGNLYLKGGNAKTNYLPNTGIFEAAGSLSKEGMISTDLERFSGSIEYANGYVKTTQGLDPFETFSVKGKYSESWLLLHAGGLLLGIAILIIFFLAMLLFLAKLKRINAGAGSSIAVGFISAFAMMLSWIAAFFIGSHMFKWIGYRYEGFFILLLILITSIITLTLLIAPPIYVGKRNGIKQGFVVLGSIIVFLIVFAVIGVLVMEIIYPPRILY